jgi:hypothetical protein
MVRSEGKASKAGVYHKRVPSYCGTQFRGPSAEPGPLEFLICLRGFCQSSNLAQELDNKGERHDII